MRQKIALALALSTLAATAGAQSQQQARGETGDRFQWSGTVPRGQWIRVKNLNGRITVRPGGGDRAEIVGVKSYRRGDPADVRIVATPSGDGGILVCAFWSENATCDEDNYQSNSSGRRGTRRDNDVSVEFTVTLPAGVNVGMSSVNGDVDVQGATAEVRASTVNGEVRAVSNGGPVTASTVNGSIDARMGALPGDGDLRFSTVNGSIEVELPRQLDADVEMRTVNGGFRTDFPMTLSGRVSPRHLRATIGKGGRELRLTTVNGSIELRKAP